MTGTEAQNVGIGTSTPTAKFEVIGDCNANIPIINATSCNHLFQSLVSTNPAVGKEIFIEFDRTKDAETWGMGLRNEVDDFWIGYGGRNNLGGHDEFVLTRTGSVGIGTAAPAAKFQVIGDCNANTPTINATSCNHLFQSLVSTNPAVGKEIFIEFDRTKDAETWGMGLRNEVDDFWIGYGGRNNLGGHDEFVLTRTGSVGIGTATPVAKFQVIGDCNANTPTINATSCNHLFQSLVSTNPAVGKEIFIEFDRTKDAETWGMGLRNEVDDFWIGYGGRNNLGGHDQFVLTRTGSVGIGTATPVAKLDILGSIKISDGTQVEGNVLTSDVNGLASWKPIAATAYSVINNTTAVNAYGISSIIHPSVGNYIITTNNFLIKWNCCLQPV